MVDSSQPDAPLAGDQPVYLDKYRLLARLGVGGMAEVLLARLDGPAGFSRHVAIKRMRPELTLHQEFVELFLEEARTASLLTHPNICQVNELSEADSDYFMVMEYLEGVPVSSVLVKAMAVRDALPLTFLAGLVQQACEGLHYAHELTDREGRPYQIIHRDISPPNLLVTSGGVVKVLDFGISKSRDSVVKTLTGQIRGKFAYMSPEQLRGEKLDCRSDVFSLGIVLFELLTGARLFRRKNRLEVFKAIVRERIPSAGEVRPDLPPALVAAVDQALARDRDRRFASARAFGAALVDAVADLGGPMTARATGDTVRAQFAGELDSRRQLLISPPGVAISRTIPDQRCEGPALSETSVETAVWSHAEVTAVDERDPDGD